MCLILLANDYHERYPLVIAANRDEYYNRPALPAAFWDHNPKVLAGMDLKQGGTWLGITTTGRFAALTNYRDLAKKKLEAPSRGSLTVDYLCKNISSESYLINTGMKADLYNGFNLLVGSPERLCYYSNVENIVRKVERGVHGLSNNLLDVPWPKVKNGVKNLIRCLQESKINPESLFELLADKEKPSDDELPQTGVGLEWERILSSIFVESPDYGTRCSTVLLVDRNNHASFWERGFEPLNGIKLYNYEVFYEFDIVNKQEIGTDQKLPG